MALGQNQPNAMKGLQLFIADLRANQKTKDHERRIQTELLNIRKQFSQKNGLNSYQRKKYVAKLAYIYITTNTRMVSELLFGIDQCLELLKTSNFNEKWIGYMTLELLMSHSIVRERVLDKVISLVKSDLDSLDTNITCLALNFVGIIANRDDLFGERLSENVFGLLRSPTSSVLVKRKASLAFLALIRNKPEIISALEESKRKLWIERITSLLGDQNDCGLLLSLLPLITFIAKEIDLYPCLRLIPQLTEILYQCLVTNTTKPESIPAEYKYGGISNPWIVVNCISLLDVLISDNGENLIGSNIDQQTLGKLRSCVSSVISIGGTNIRDAVARNAQYVTFFTMLGFACKLDPTNEAIANSVTGLCKLLEFNDVNTRYSTIDLLIKICTVNGRTAIKTIQDAHMDQLLKLIKHENDTTLLKKSYGLLYILTDGTNFKPIVDHLLVSLQENKSLDLNLKEDLTFKIEKLIETHANDLNWFVLTSLRLLSLHSSIKDDHVWKRICQIVVNNEPLHKIACEQLIDYMQSTSTSESLVKAGVFLLGEYTNLVIQKLSAGYIFNLFTQKYFQVGNLTKAMILTAMIKLYHVEPLLYSVVVKFFQLELNSFDLVLQTRSYEYLKIIQYSKVSDKAFLDKVLPGMPPFVGPASGSFGYDSVESSNQIELASLDYSQQKKPKEPIPLPAPPRSRKNTNLYHSHPLAPNWEVGFKRMMIYRQGVFYNNSLINILYRLERSPENLSLATLSFTIVNKSDTNITGLSCEVIPFRADNNPEYVVQVKESPQSNLNANARTVFTFEITTRFAFSPEHSPLLSLQFRCGGQSSNIRLKIGYTILSTLPIDEQKISLPQFIQRWKSIGESLGKTGEFTEILKCQNIDQQKISSIVSRIGLDVVDQNSVSNTIFIGGIIHTKSDGNFGCLIKLKLLREDNRIEITCKSTSSGELSKNISNCMKRVF